MKYYIIAGEASGDLHASSLIKEIRILDKNADFRGWGGDKMKDLGTHLVKHYRDIAFMGFVEVVLHLKEILRNIDLCKNDIQDYKPDTVILVDYPGFNLRIAEFAHKNNIKVCYYISPQIWAWNRSRIRKIKVFVDRMFVILPFEKDFYAKYNYGVDYVGHPLLDAGLPGDLKKSQTSRYDASEDPRPIIALLPGSRKQEISRILKIMLKVVPDFPDYRFMVAGVSSAGIDIYEKSCKDYPVEVVYDDTYEILAHSFAALVTSGTATLETAIMNVPEVICYRAGYLSYQIAKRVVKVKYIGLVNLIMDKPVVKELIQNDLSRKNLIEELHTVTSEPETRDRILNEYKELIDKLGGGGASRRTAELIIKYLTDNHK